MHERGQRLGRRLGDLQARRRCRAPATLCFRSGHAQCIVTWPPRCVVTIVLHLEFCSRKGSTIRRHPPLYRHRREAIAFAWDKSAAYTADGAVCFSYDW